jgi:hypothetical protein
MDVQGVFPPPLQQGLHLLWLQQYERAGCLSTTIAAGTPSSVLKQKGNENYYKYQRRIF